MVGNAAQFTGGTPAGHSLAPRCLFGAEVAAGDSPQEADGYAVPARTPMLVDVQESGGDCVVAGFFAKFANGSFL